MSNRPQLLPEIGTGLGNRKKADTDLGFRGETPAIPKGPPAETQKPFQKDAAVQSNPGISKVFHLRKKILNLTQEGKASEGSVKKMLTKAGIKDPRAVETILSTQLNDNVVKYFLGATNNDPKKARALAKKFGFEV